MLKRLLLTLPLLFTLLLLSKPAHAQAPCPFAIGSGCTTVTGTVTDPSGIPYANATIAAKLTPYDQPTISGQQFPMDYKTNLSVAGTFSLIVADTSRMTGSHSWVFTVNIFPAQAPPVGSGPQQFTITVVTVSGSSQSITSQLNAAALALTTVPIGSGSFSAGGDLSGTAHSQTVIGVQGAPVPSTATVVGTNSSRQLIDNSAALLANNTTGNAANLSGTPTLPNGTSAATQSPGDTSANLATDQFVQNAVTASLSPYIAPQAVSGCGVEWTGLLTFTVGACTYTINGVNYSSPLANLTLSAADPTNPRIDVIYVDTTQVAQVLTGTPAASPVAPTVDVSTQLPLTFVTVSATATTPDNITKVDIYHENVEWTTSRGGTNSTRVNLASTNNPYDGTVDIEFGNGGTVTSTTYAQATDPAAGTVDLAASNSLVFYIRNKASWPSTRSITVQWLNGATLKGTPIVIANGSLGFNATTNVTSYQQITIPTSLFQLNGVPVTAVRFTVTGSGTALTGFYLDDITLQAGINSIPPLPTTLMNWKGTYSSGVQYNANDMVTLNGFYYVALGSNLNVPVTTTATWAGIGSCSTALTGQLLTMNNAAAPSCLSPGIGGRTVAGGSDTILGDSGTAIRDRATTIKYTSASAVAVTLPQAGSSGFGSNFVYTSKVNGAGTVTVTPTTSTINGASTLVASQNSTCTIYSPDNTSYTSLCYNGTRGFGTTFGDSGGSALTAGSTVYFRIPYACTIQAWNVTVDAGTVTFDVWKIASGTAIPTIANTIDASDFPTLSTGTANRGTALTGWTTAVAKDDIFGFNLKTVATAKYAEIDLQCNTNP